MLPLDDATKADAKRERRALGTFKEISQKRQQHSRQHKRKAFSVRKSLEMVLVSIGWDVGSPSSASD